MGERKQKVGPRRKFYLQDLTVIPGVESRLETSIVYRLGEFDCQEWREGGSILKKNSPTN